MTLISLCMIVKNESELLPRCLDAVNGLWDELIVVDTGSADDTVSIAEEYGANVLQYEMPEPGHLGAARNIGLDAATGEWVVVLDADEVLTQAEGVRYFLHNLPEPDITAVMLKFENYDVDGNVTIAWWQPRIWKRGLYRYVHRAHEVPVETVDPSTLKSVSLNITVRHLPPREPHDKGGMLLAMLEADVADRPDDRHSVYFLCRQYAWFERWDEAIDTGLRYLSITGGVDNHDVFGTLATAYMQTEQTEQAIAILHHALGQQPHRRVWWMRLAEIYMTLAQWNIALAYLRGASELQSVWEWTEEVHFVTVGLTEMIDECQNALASGGKHGE